MMQRALPESSVIRKSQIADDYPITPPPPFNIEAEQAFLGALLTWNDVLEEADFIEAGHFFVPLHSAIFEIIAETIGQGRKVSFITMKDSLANAQPVNQNTTAVQYLNTLAAHACIRSSAVHTARAIVDLSTRRQLILIGEDLALVAREAAINTSPASLIEEAETRLLGLVQASEKDQAVPARQFVGEALQLALRALNGEKPGVPTFFSDLDAKMGGLHPSNLVILAGRPSMGKSALALNIATNLAKHGKPVGFFSLEMSREELGMRILGDYVDISPEKLRKGHFDRAKRDTIQELAIAATKLPLYVDHTGGLSIAQVSSRARRMRRDLQIELLVIDYLQLMNSGKQRVENRVQDVTAITMGLKALAKELGIPILALSQLNRAVDNRENKRPHLADLRESGSIEQDADIVLFVYREEYYVEREAPSQTNYSAYSDWQAKLRACAGKAEIIVGKHRHGPTGTIALAFSGEMTRFADLAREVARV